MSKSHLASFWIYFFSPEQIVLPIAVDSVSMEGGEFRLFLYYHLELEVPCCKEF